MKIVFVDDEVCVLSTLLSLFRNEDYEIFTATSGKEGLQIMENNKISLVMLDSRMPEMSGLDFLSLSRYISPDTIRVILTAYADLQASLDAINKGEVCQFITKPWNDEELKMIVKQSLEDRNLMLVNRTLTRTIKIQASLFKKLEESHPGITHLGRLENGAIVVDDADYDNLFFEDIVYAGSIKLASREVHPN